MAVGEILPSFPPFSAYQNEVLISQRHWENSSHRSYFSEWCDQEKELGNLSGIADFFLLPLCSRTKVPSPGHGYLRLQGCLNTLQGGQQEALLILDWSATLLPYCCGLWSQIMCMFRLWDHLSLNRLTMVHLLSQRSPTIGSIVKVFDGHCTLLSSWNVSIIKKCHGLKIIINLIDFWFHFPHLLLIRIPWIRRFAH